MTAIFFAHYEKEDACKRYEEFAKAKGFSMGRITYGNKPGDNQPCLFKSIGENGTVIICQNAKGKDFLLFENFVKDENRKKRIWALMRYGVFAALSNNADKDCVRLFWHNGNIIPDGYEAWANAVIADCNGFGNWKLALLASARHDKFNLDDIGKSIHDEDLESEDAFVNWINNLDKTLWGA